jgi:hypothetical protein
MRKGQALRLSSFIFENREGQVSMMLDLFFRNSKKRHKKTPVFYQKRGKPKMAIQPKSTIAYAG